MARSRFFPPDHLTHGEWTALARRYGDPTRPPDFETEEFRDRRERLRLTIKRLTGKGINAKILHTALMHGLSLHDAHRDRVAGRKGAVGYNARVDRIRKDLDRALASLRKLAPPGIPLDDAELFAVRDLLLQPVRVPPAERPRGGRPNEWIRVTDTNLRDLGVSESDRRELLSALGLVQEE